MASDNDQCLQSNNVGRGGTKWSYSEREQTTGVEEVKIQGWEVPCGLKGDLEDGARQMRVLCLAPGGRTASRARAWEKSGNHEKMDFGVEDRRGPRVQMARKCLKMQNRIVMARGQRGKG